MRFEEADTTPTLPTRCAPISLRPEAAGLATARSCHQVVGAEWDLPHWSSTEGEMSGPDGGNQQREGSIRETTIPLLTGSAAHRRGGQHAGSKVSPSERQQGGEKENVSKWSIDVASETVARGLAVLQNLAPKQVGSLSPSQLAATLGLSAASEGPCRPGPNLNQAAVSGRSNTGGSESAALERV